MNKPHDILMFVARHGTTVLNEQGCYRGPLDPDLDGQGWRDAHALSFYFEPIDLSGVFFSPKKRSRHTAMLVSKKQDPKIVYSEHHNLQALNVGHLGGKEKTPETEAEVKYHIDNPDIPFKDGESLNEFRARVRPLLKDGLELAMSSGKPILIVAHSSVVHETGQLFNGDHNSTLVLPGGVAAVYVCDGELGAGPIFKPDLEKLKGGRAPVVT